MAKEELKHIVAAQALRHPTWNMGAKITIDSATLMNKGFEMIEAKWLFGVEAERIEVVVHPQSIIHSAVQFADGAVKAQMGVPDMRMPIQYALTYPDRKPLTGERLDLFKLGMLTFERPNLDNFPCLAMAYEAARRKGNAACVMNAANEVANLAFRQDRISYPQLCDIIAKTMEHVAYVPTPSLEVYLQTDREARQYAASLI